MRSHDSNIMRDGWNWMMTSAVESMSDVTLVYFLMNNIFELRHQTWFNSRSNKW